MAMEKVKYPSIQLSKDWYERCKKAEKELYIVIREINLKLSNKDK